MHMHIFSRFKHLCPFLNLEKLSSLLGGINQLLGKINVMEPIEYKGPLYYSWKHSRAPH